MGQREGMEVDFENPVASEGTGSDNNGTNDRDAELSHPMLWTKTFLTWIGASPTSPKCMVYFTVLCLMNLCVSRARSLPPAWVMVELASKAL